MPILDEFDLLFVYDDNRYRRLPFSYCRLLKPVGIFPFADDYRYIALDEVEGKKHTDKDVDESRLLDVDFCMRVFKIKDKLNAYLAALKKPLLSGKYLADRKIMQGCGWIISFDDNDFNTLPADYYGGNVAAKLRYMQQEPEENRGLF